MAACRVLEAILLGVLMVQLVTHTTDAGRDDHSVPDQKGATPNAPQGPPGAPGQPGIPGLPGMKGEPGLSGLPGLSGQPGYLGITGIRGDRGENGFPGRKGHAGDPGFPGRDGQPGSENSESAKGEPGPIGVPGRSGPPGGDGFPGGKGASGDKGEKGDECNCGSVQTHRTRAVAFSAEVDKVPEPTLRPIPVPVSRIMADVGSWFQANVSRFIAPSDGMYAFSLVTISEGSVAIPISLVHNGQEVMYTGRTDTSIGIYPVGTNRIFLNLSRDDYVDVRVRPKEQGVVSSLADLFYSETRMTFLGYKLM